MNATAYTQFAKEVTFGELAVSTGLNLGIFTGFAALFGGFLNLNFMMAGIGLDRYLRPLIGVPGKGGYLFHREDANADLSVAAPTRRAS